MEDGEKLLDPELVAELTTAIRFTLDRLV